MDIDLLRTFVEVHRLSIFALGGSLRYPGCRERTHRAGVALHNFSTAPDEMGGSPEAIDSRFADLIISSGAAPATSSAWTAPKPRNCRLPAACA